MKTENTLLYKKSNISLICFLSSGNFLVDMCLNETLNTLRRNIVNK